MIRYPALLKVRQLANQFAAEGREAPWRFLSLSWQDVVCTDEQLVAALDQDRFDRLAYHPNSDKIVRWHKCERITTRVPDWHQLLSLLGFEAESVDLVPARGCETFIDLNERHQEPRFRGGWDVVLDNVSHHCVDPWTALRNVADMPSVGGYVVHVLPLVMVNHGFYSFGPTLFHDFYAANGYDVVSHEWFDVDAGQAKHEVHAVGDPTRRLKEVTTNSMQLVVARRRSAGSPWLRPTQSKFVRHPESELVEGETR